MAETGAILGVHASASGRWLLINVRPFVNPPSHFIPKYSVHFINSNTSIHEGTEEEEEERKKRTKTNYNEVTGMTTGMWDQIPPVLDSDRHCFSDCLQILDMFAGKLEFNEGTT